MRWHPLGVARLIVNALTRGRPDGGVNRPLPLLDNAVDGRQSQAGAAALFLGGKNGSNTRFSTASSMPVPVSLTVSTT